MRDSFYTAITTLLLVLGSLSFGQVVVAQQKARVILVKTPQSFKEKMTQLKPGDHLVLGDGVYKDIGEFYMRVSGVKGRPIVIRPQNPHGVTITGLLQWHVYGSYIHIEGLNFVRCKIPPTDKPYGSIIKSNPSSRGIRVSACRFISCETQKRNNGSVIGAVVNLRGDEHRLDHCLFLDPLARPLVLNGDRELMDQRIKGSLLIDHNIFRDMTRLRALKTQGEAIFMGTGFSHYRTHKLGAVLEYNLFDKANGDTHGEIITVKSSANTFRYNVFANAPGAWYEGGSHLSLRSTDDVVIHNNLFIRLGCGIWVTGRRHQIVNNLFIDIDFAALHFPVGNLKAVKDNKAVIMVDGEEIDMKKPGVYGYIAKKYGAVFWAAEDCLIAHNYFGDLKRYGVNAHDKKKPAHGTLFPRNNRIVNNIFQADGPITNGPLMNLDKPELNTIQRNLYIVPKTVPLGKVGQQAIQGRPSDLTMDKETGWPIPRSKSTARSKAIRVSGHDLLKKDFLGQSRSSSRGNDLGPIQWSRNISKLSSGLPPVPPEPGTLDNKPLAADFKSWSDTVKVGEYVVLDAAFSSGKIAFYEWDFGDGVNVKVEGNALVHRWRKPGVYEVSLTVHDRNKKTKSTRRKVKVKR